MFLIFSVVQSKSLYMSLKQAAARWHQVQKSYVVMDDITYLIGNHINLLTIEVQKFMIFILMLLLNPFEKEVNSK